MATCLLSILIFESAGFIIYSQLKSGKICDECKSACPVKQVQKTPMVDEPPVRKK